jgi:hypothetical protein
MPYVNKPRPYKREYALYQGSEEQKKNRAMRNAARRKAMAEGKVKKGDGKDVHHTTAISKGGTNKSKLAVVPASANRSFARSADNKLVSETSPREKKKHANSR